MPKGSGRGTKKLSFCRNRYVVVAAAAAVVVVVDGNTLRLDIKFRSWISGETVINIKL
jgi:hypothetical protein